MLRIWQTLDVKFILFVPVFLCVIRAFFFWHLLWQFTGLFLRCCGWRSVKVTAVHGNQFLSLFIVPHSDRTILAKHKKRIFLYFVKNLEWFFVLRKKTIWLITLQGEKESPTHSVLSFISGRKLTRQSQKTFRHMFGCTRIVNFFTSGNYLNGLPHKEPRPHSPANNQKLRDWKNNHTNILLFHLAISLNGKQANEACLLSMKMCRMEVCIAIETCGWATLLLSIGPLYLFQPNIKVQYWLCQAFSFPLFLLFQGKTATIHTKGGREDIHFSTWQSGEGVPSNYRKQLALNCSGSCLQ